MHLTIFSLGFHIQEIQYGVLCSVYVSSHLGSIVYPKFTYIVADAKISFFFKVNSTVIVLYPIICPYLYTHINIHIYNVSMHPSIYAHFNCYHSLDTVNTVAVNIRAQLHEVFISLALHTHPEEEWLCLTVLLFIFQ